MTISKDIKFDCAHMLSNYEGKCSNLHGHTYHGTVTLEGPASGDTSMVLDYNEIKNIVDMFDHAIVFSAPGQRNDAETELYEWAYRHDMRCIEMTTGKSTAENIATYIAKQFIQLKAGITAVHVRLSETDGSWAVVEARK